jgi:4-carboxymuconolactone decarboxylase
MSDSQAMTPAQKAIGDFAPKLVSLTDDVLFGDVWERTEPSKRDRSLITVAALITNGSTEQLRGHLARAKDNGLSEAELKEVIIHLAFLRRLASGDVRRHRCEGDLRRLTAPAGATGGRFMRAELVEARGCACPSTSSGRI